MSLQNITLELSLKPFKDTSDDGIRRVARELFEQWRVLGRHAAEVNVMLWPADGSEILDYRGKLDAEFEWACWVGGANPRLTHKGDSQKVGLHSRRYPYIENPPRLTYRWMKRLVKLLKEVGREVTGLPVRVGTTFDPGPEFAISPFKYERHNEICSSGTMGKSSFMSCYATLNADDVAYAGFPEGIPQGTSIGTFLGRQSQHFLTDMGFDFLWLSNGFGFGLETWALRGAVFDGKQFSSERCPEVSEKILGFWRDFRKECPDIPLETRGTNLSTAMDLSSDAAPLRDIYRGGFKMEPPPNSPWAALNGDFGLELVGWMSHIAELPGDTFPFRFYTHDPWWNNSPWLDRYMREPHDIFLPLSVSRLDENAEVRRPTEIHFLSADDCWGNLPERVAREVTAHILDAWETGPDAPGPLVWIYPFDEYHDWTYAGRIDEVFFGDWFMRGAVNNGLPLNTVMSTKCFAAAQRGGAGKLANSILVSPVPQAGSEWEKNLLAALRGGGRVMLYGPVARASEELRKALGIELAAPLAGEFELKIQATPDMLPEGSVTSTLVHPALFSSGGIEAVASALIGATILATVHQGNETRVAALTRADAAWHGGRLVWVRGTVACDTEKVGGHLLVPLTHQVSYPGERLMRLALQSFGIELLLEKQAAGFDRVMETGVPELKQPLVGISRHKNAFFFAGYNPDATTAMHMRLPQGAPLLHGVDTLLRNGRATYHMPRGWRRECRVFVEQNSGQVGCQIVCVSTRFDVRNGLLVSGLSNAKLRFFHEPGTGKGVSLLSDPVWPFIEGRFLKPEHRRDSLGEYLQLENVSGDLMISW